MPIELLISDPRADIIDGPAAIVVGHGASTRGEREAMRAVADGSRPPEALEDVARGAEDAVLVVVPRTDRRSRTALAWRTATSSHELYLMRRGRSGLLLTDSFRSACASLPVADRGVSDQAVVDHLLFRTVPTDRTYLRAVGRLAQGERLVFDASAGTVLRERFETLVGPDEGPSSRSAQLDSIERALSRVVASCVAYPNTANMLSGGVDSSLIQTYLPRDFASVSTAIDSPEFAFEVEYARTASRLLDVEHEFISVQEDAYGCMLERSIRALGLPPHHLQTILVDATFQSDHAGFITGQFADGLLGLGVARTLTLVDALRPLGYLAPSRIGKVAQARGVSQDLRRSVGNPRGPAMRFALYTEADLVAKMVGVETVDDALRARLDYVEAICPFVDRDRTGLTAHLELGHLIDFFCDDATSLWRQLAHARGKNLYAPFIARSVVESALSIPAGDRYVRWTREKHLLKGLLARRLPSYRVHKSKGASGLPVERFLASGPLREMRRDYELPDFVPRDLVDAVRSGTGWLSWNCLTFALWRDSVLRDPLLEPPESTRVVRPGRASDR